MHLWWLYTTVCITTGRNVEYVIKNNSKKKKKIFRSCSINKTLCFVMQEKTSQAYNQLWSQVVTLVCALQYVATKRNESKNVHVFSSTNWWANAEDCKPPMSALAMGSLPDSDTFNSSSTEVTLTMCKCALRLFCSVMRMPVNTESPLNFMWWKWFQDDKFMSKHYLAKETGGGSGREEITVHIACPQWCVIRFYFIPCMYRK